MKGALPLQERAYGPSRRRPVARGLALVLFVTVCVGIAPRSYGQSSRDAEFARVLLRRGFTDLAEEEARRIEADPNYPESVRGDAGYLLARVLKKKANEHPEQAAEYLEEMASLIEELKRKYPTHQMSAVADLEKLQVKVREAESRLAQANDEPDPNKAERDRKAAIEIFEDVLGQFEAVIAGLNQRLEKEQNDDLVYKRDLAEYLYASAWFSYAKALPESDTRRKEAFTKARDLFQTFFDERGDYFNLQALSYLGIGKAQIELGEYEDAVETFIDGVEIEVPFEQPDPDLQRELEQFVRDAKAEAYYWLLVAQVRAGRNEDALATWADLLERFPEGRETHFGKLAQLIYGKALAALGRYGEAADAIGEIVERSMQSKKLIPGYDIDPYGVSAAKTLAEIAEHFTGFFPAPLQYRAGQGFIFKREYEKATWALKGVLAAAASDAERETWGPKALIDLALAYDHLGRPVDAALAYQGLYRLFPNAPNADTAMRLAKQRYLELEKADGKGFYKRLADEVTDDMQRSLRGIGVEKIKYNRGVESQRLGRFAEAARYFEKVEPEISVDGKRVKVDFYGKALANAGYCWYMAARKERSERRRAELEKKAKTALERAYAYGQKEGDAGAQAASAYFLALIASDGDAHEAGAYREALERLAVFDGPLANDRAYRDKALQQMVHCHVMLAQRAGDDESKRRELEKAERRYAQLAKSGADEGEVGLAAFELGDAYNALAMQANKRGAAKDHARALKKAAKYLLAWIEHSKRPRFGQLAWVGDIAFRAGEYERAEKVLAKAIELADAGTLSEKQKAELAAEYARIERGASLVQLGRVDEALSLLDRAKKGFEAAGKDPSEDFVYAWTLDEALYRQWKASGDVRKLGVLKEAHDSYWQVLGLLGETGWRDMVRTYSLPERTYYVADKEAALRSLEIALAVKQWRFVQSQIQQMLDSGALDDLVRRKLGADVTGEIIAEDRNGVTVRKSDGETVVVPRTEIRSIERFPNALRKRFVELLETAKREGGL